LESHLPDPNNPEPPSFLPNFVKNYIPDEYLTKSFLFDLGATWVIYEFIIAPIKWPYYFVATRFIVNALRRRGLFTQAAPSKIGQKVGQKVKETSQKGREKVKSKIEEVKSKKK